jgi:hypothetical protein
VQVFMRWVSSKRLRDAAGRPRALPRTGAAPSFEALAKSVTQHVHPRSLLDELCRLGLATLSADGLTVSLLTDRFVPREDDALLFEFLGANAGDHLAAAGANVVHRDRRHFEQAVFTDELSKESAREVRTLAKALWATAVAAAVPALERLIAEDKAKGRAVSERARIGLFSYHEPLQETDREEDTDPSR